jgi:CD2 antigen cytoplasmic tail-binding protein 2
MHVLGQEEGGVDYEEGMRFTPFNMKDELEEGHFDTEGTYIFKKEVC